ncbi:MAG: porin PorA family protein [Rhodococcus sp. (in: high G+C Gram-positive bacteria)]|uniref:porin PorA family protein n=1 Tax=Rhodococcus sp. TaxID=1831 RepID=UPI003BB577C0
MSLRRSSLVFAILGVLLIAAAALIRFVAVPSMTKLPADIDSGSTYAGSLQSFDPGRFALGEEVAFTVARHVEVDHVDGDVAVITSVAETQRPEGDSTSAHTYAISRVDYGQQPAPDGFEVEDQKNAMVLSLPMNPSPDGNALYDTVTREPIPLEYDGDGVRGGRNVYQLTGSLTAPIVDPAVLAPAQTGIAAMAGVGDGSVLPKQILEILAGFLPPEQAQQLTAALATQPDLVPVVLTADTTIDMDVDQRFGTPLRTVQDQTTVLNMQAGDELIPLLDLSRAVVNTDDASVASAAAELSSSQTMLDIVSKWLPLLLTVIGVALIVVAFIRRNPAAGTPIAAAAAPTTPVDAPADADDDVKVDDTKNDDVKVDDTKDGDTKDGDTKDGDTKDGELESAKS